MMWLFEAVLPWTPGRISYIRAYHTDSEKVARIENIIEVTINAISSAASRFLPYYTFTYHHYAEAIAPLVMSMYKSIPYNMITPLCIYFMIPAFLSPSASTLGLSLSL